MDTPNSQSTNTPLAVTCDLWLTLIAEPDGTARSAPRQNLRIDRIHGCLQNAGHSVSRELVEEHFYAIYRAIVADQDLGLDIVFERRVAMFLDRLGGDADADLKHLHEEVGAAIDQAFLTIPPKLIPGALETLESIAAMQLPIALLSNAGFNSAKMYDKWLEQVGISGFMQYIFISNAHDCAKPNPHVFQLASEALSVPLDHCLHLGDNPVADIAGAGSCGMSTVLVGSGDAAGEDPAHRADFTIATIADAPAIVAEWSQSLRGSRA